MFTSGQVSKMLGVSGSTLRRYVSLFSNHLSDQATKARGRRFGESDVSVLSRVKELFAEGRTESEIETLIPIVTGTSDEPTPDNVLALVPTISKALTEAIDAARMLRVDVDDVQTRLSEVENREGELAQHSEETAQRLERLEEWLALPWYKRIRSKPFED